MGAESLQIHAIKITVFVHVIIGYGGTGEESVNIVFDIRIVQRELVVVISGNRSDAPCDFDNDYAEEEQDVEPTHPADVAAERDEAPDAEAKDNAT